MIDTLQIEEPVQVLHAVPKLLVEWSSPWREFVDSIRPALARSERRLAGEAPFGLVPFRIMIPSYVLEGLLIFVAVVVYAKVAEMRPYVAPHLSSHDVIYYSGDELPRTEDLGGSETGTTGRAGGQEAHHRTQTIKIARGGSLVPKVVDAPNLKLPSSQDAVANLLAIRPDPGPPPSEGMRSSRVTPNLATTLVAPAPNVIRDYTRNGVALEAVAAPAPALTRDRALTAPNLSASIVPPAPNVSSDHTLVAPKLDPFVAPPAANIARDRTRAAPSLTPSVVAPAQNVSQDKSRAAPSLAANVIAPAPGSVTRELSSAPVQMTSVAVVPPPVSAPERATMRDPKLSLPAPAVVAPPSSSDISRDMRHLASGSIPDPSKTVAPPPPTPSGSGSFMSSLIGKIFGPSEVAPPPSAVNSTGTRSGPAAALTPNIVAPPSSISTSAAGGNPGGGRKRASASLTPNVAAPPSSGVASGAAEGTGTRSTASSAGPRLGPPVVVPPPPSLAGTGGGTGNNGGAAGAAGGTLLANNIVPPPPSLGGGSSPTGSGLGRKGTGLGAPLDIGSNLAPSGSGGSGKGAGAVISNQPGTKIGVPSTGGRGALAMSPSGGDKPGIGGAGGGTGIGRGDGPGSGMSGAGSGAGKTGAGRGSDPNARGGISPSPGPGGAGNATSGNPAVPGVSVSGGSTMVTLPSFGSDPSTSDPAAPGHSPKQRQSFDVDIVATASSGGAFEPYKNLLHGEKHTIYPETGSSLGTAVMEYAEESVKTTGVLKPPQSIRTTLPDGLPRARMVVICTLDASGNLKNVRVLDPGPADMTAKVVAALRSWKFQPALRGDQPVEVTAILGFGIDTNDRF